MKDEFVGLTWVSPWIVGFLAFLLIPAGMSLYFSFTDYPLLESPVWVGLGNYKRLLSDEVFHKALVNTFIYAGAAIPLSVLLAVVLAALLNTKGLRWTRFFEAAIFMPTLAPLVASSMVWMWILNGRFGLLNQFLGLLHISGPNWLLREGWAMAALVIVALWGVGQAVILCVAALKEVPEQLYEAANLDGMGPVRQFINVTLPMISPVILFNTITMLIGAFQVFVVPYVLFQKDKGGPNKSGYFYTSYLYDNAFVYGQMGYASALAWVQLLIILLLTGLLFLASRRLVFYRGA
ncbi:MAG: sugar ABC transporter permease [Planctomycetes bacterium]|nr:sugar ABC transporter permease [Planctomycetota bacterium]